MNASERVTIAGWGAVSAAGWGITSLFDAIQADAIKAPQRRQRDGARQSVEVRAVPQSVASRRIRHPRLRRASPQVKFAASACMEALGEERVAQVKAGELRLGIVFATMCGAVQYSNRFYQEVIDEPATASPILFPETVFNATSSHLSAIFNSQAANYTVVGDSAEFLSACRIAADWLHAGEVDGCLVVGSEELDWVSWEAMQLFDPRGIASEGAGALYLEPAISGTKTIVLEAVTKPVLWLNHAEKASSARLTRNGLPPDVSSSALLALSAMGHAKTDLAELTAWSDWNGPRLALGRELGNCMGAGVALNAALACEHLVRGSASEAIVSAAGHHHQCLAARLRSQ